MADHPAEADRLTGAPHPRETSALYGHAEAERALLDAYRSGRMHHAWILGGEEGVGKATLAYRLARFVLANPDPAALGPATDLAVDPDHRAARLVAQLSHPDLFVLRRGTTGEGRAAGEIRIDDVRRLVSFFSTTAGEGGWRIAIIDSADDLNRNGANALLKVLEEPPARSLFLIISTAPKRLLPTIRSRCRTLLMKPLLEADVLRVLRSLGDLTGDVEETALQRIADAAEGSVRRAAAMIGEDSLALRDAVTGLLDRLPAIDHAAVHALAEEVAGRDGAEGFALLVGVVQDWLHAQLARASGRADARLAGWAALWEKIARSANEAEIYNLDRRPLVLAIFSDLAAASRA